jgi:hypothetical protein
MKKAFLTIISLILISSPAWALTVTGMDTAENLAQALLGSGVTISNVTYTGATSASGYFQGASVLGTDFFDSGIVLTSGSASYLSGSSNTSDSISGSNSAAGDADLDTLIPQSTHDATVLEFEFTSQSSSVYFNYFFGSEEYNEYVNSSYNDVFAFFFNGENVALITGTETAVSINNINNGTNSEYYNDNDNSDSNAGAYPFEYDGFTDVFTVSLTGLTAGETYQIKLAIADAGDYILDSGVFLQGGSFSDEETPVGATVPEPSTVMLFGVGLAAAAGIRRKKNNK